MESSVSGSFCKKALPNTTDKQWPFVFIHINKTGGTSIAKAIGMEKNHFTAFDLENIVDKETWKKTYKFSFIRNPWDKVLSHYKWRVVTNQTKLRDRSTTFDHWVKVTLGPNKDTFFYDKPRMFMPQINWLKDSRGQICMDSIGRFESIEDDFKRIALQIGIETKLPHLNATLKTNYRDFYDKKTRSLVADWFQEDIAYFNYKY